VNVADRIAHPTDAPEFKKHKRQCFTLKVSGWAEASGWWVKGVSLDQPPRLREIKRLRDVYLIAQPPPVQEGLSKIA
jgi:hypothetical protein